MEILIQDLKTQRFLNDKAIWVLDQADARVFLVCGEALRFCVEHGVKGGELAFRYLPGRDGHSRGIAVTTAVPVGGYPV